MRSPISNGGFFFGNGYSPNHRAIIDKGLDGFGELDFFGYSANRTHTLCTSSRIW